MNTKFSGRVCDGTAARAAPAVSSASMSRRVTFSILDSRGMLKGKYMLASPLRQAHHRLTAHHRLIRGIGTHYFALSCACLTRSGLINQFGVWMCDSEIALE